MTHQSSPFVALNSTEELAVEIDPLGAQLSVLRDREGRDLLWGGDPAVWAGRAPILFPIVGALAGGEYRLGSKTYLLPRHGFARGKLFEVIDSTPAAASFRLRADAATLAVYPFEFELQVDFALQGSKLSMTTHVRNRGHEPMPASFGYHPAFRWPLPFGRGRAAHFIEFTEDEPAPMRRLDAAGLLAPESSPTPIVSRRLPLTDALFEEDVIIFDAIRSRSVSYGAAEGPLIRVSYPDAPYLGVWTKPGAGFICIEPWHGVADVVGYSGDFAAKLGVFTVQPGVEFPIEMEVELLRG